MKKTYQNPITMIVKVKTSRMIATSIDLYSVDATDTAMSREGNRQNSWDDEEEDY